MDSVVYSTLLEGEGRVQEAAFDEPRQRLALALAGGGLSVWQRQQRQEDWQPLAQLATDEQASQLAWAPAEHGRVLAAAGSSGSISIWEERQSPPGAGGPAAAGMQRQASIAHDAPVVAIAFSPGECGLQLTVASPSRLSMYAPSPGGSHRWSLEDRLDLDPPVVCRCFAWRPCAEGLPHLLALGTSEGVSIWRYSPEGMQWRKAAEHASEAVTALAWAPALARPAELIAAASGADVSILSCRGSADAIQVSAAPPLQQAAAVHSLRWNALGTSLAVATEEPAAAVWRQDLLGEWKAVDRVIGTEASMALD